jgi:tRNA A37 threonylcarbamoyltransferase TsaD
MKIMPSQMQAIFDPVINQVIALVKGQISSTKRNVKAVLLVGGFGQNIYLKERLRSCLSSLIEVRQPANAWTAVVRGAVMMGAHSNAVKLLSRVARKHYGVILADRYDRSIHSRSERYINSLLLSSDS